MRKELAIKLVDKAKEIGERYSNPDRTYNNMKETFLVSEIIPLSEYTALVIYVKNTGKKALSFFYCVPSKEYWAYFFLSSGHLCAFSDKVREVYQKIEAENFKFNFEEKGE